MEQTKTIILNNLRRQHNSRNKINCQPWFGTAYTRFEADIFMGFFPLGSEHIFSVFKRFQCITTLNKISK